MTEIANLLCHLPALCVLNELSFIVSGEVNLIVKKLALVKILHNIYFQRCGKPAGLALANLPLFKRNHD